MVPEASLRRQEATSADDVVYRTTGDPSPDVGMHYRGRKEIGCRCTKVRDTPAYPEYYALGKFHTGGKTVKIHRKLKTPQL
jgi:hypothetical protein